MSWLDKTANITRLRHINLHKCWLLAGFLFGIMILWVGIWLEPNLSQQDLTKHKWLAKSALNFSSNWIAKLDQTDTGILLLLLLIPVSVCSASSSRIPEESTSLGLRGRRVQNGRRRGTRMEDAFCRLRKPLSESCFFVVNFGLSSSSLVRGKGDLDPLVSKVKRCFQSWGWQKSPPWYPRVLACPELWFRLMISPDSQFW